MKNLISIIMTFVCTLFILTAKADDTIFSFGTNNGTSTNTWNYIGGGTNLNAVPGCKLNGCNEATLGWLTSKRAAFGFGASPRERNTALPENTQGVTITNKIIVE